LPARLIRTLPFASLQSGAQVASLRCPILRWSTQDYQSLITQQEPQAKVSFCSHVSFC